MLCKQIKKMCIRLRIPDRIRKAQIHLNQTKVKVNPVHPNQSRVRVVQK